MLKKFCNHRGCNNLTQSKYCEQHIKTAYDYDNYRGTAAERGYDARWRRARLRYLKRHPLCVRCTAEGRLVAATVVDHIIPHKGNYELFWNEDNWQPLCKRCHDRKTATEDGGFKRTP